MFQIWSYLSFLVRSTNHHGVHSPFVFQFLTQCLYRKNPKHRSKVGEITIKSIPYFNFKTIKLDRKLEELYLEISRSFPDLQFDQMPYDLVVVSAGNLEEFDYTALEPHCHNGSMILLQGIHRSRTNREAWNALCATPSIHVSIDYYYGGILFLRKEQEKQHFRIRI